MSKNLREEMPGVAGWIDELREVFGKDMIDGQIRKGMKGEGTFWAAENGHVIGSRSMGQTSARSWDQQGNPIMVRITRNLEPPYTVVSPIKHGEST
jgi:hypothetical protein